MRIPQLIGKEVVVDAPNMTFEEARVAVLQAASQLQGLLTIYPALELAAIAEKGLIDLKRHKEQLEKEIETLQETQKKEQSSIVVKQQQETAAFEERIAQLKKEVQGFFEQNRQAEIEVQTARAATKQEIERLNQVAEDTKTALNKELLALTQQVKAAEDKLTTTNNAIDRLKAKL